MLITKIWLKLNLIKTLPKYCHLLLDLRFKRSMSHHGERTVKQNTLVLSIININITRQSCHHSETILCSA